MRLLAVSASLLALVLCACSSPTRAIVTERPPLAAELLRTPLLDTAGRPLVLADELATGKKVALVFWQEWCPSCRSEAPELVAASREHADMEIVGVVSGPDSAVDAATLERAIREMGLPYRNVRDRELDLTRALGITGTPTIVLLGSHGEVLYHGHESPDWDELL